MVRTTDTSSIRELIARVIEPEGGLSEEFAHFLLRCRFPEADQRRLKQLAEKQRQGALTAEEEAEMDRYIRVADLFEVLKAKALVSLERKKPGLLPQPGFLRI